MMRVSGGGERQGQSGGVSDEVSDAAGIVHVRAAPPLVSAPSFAREITWRLSCGTSGLRSLLRHIKEASADHSPTAQPNPPSCARGRGRGRLEWGL